METLVEVGKQVPALAVLAWIVFYFVNATLRINADHRETLMRISAESAERIARVSERHERHLAEIIKDYRKVAESSQAASEKVYDVLIRLQAEMGVPRQIVDP